MEVAGGGIESPPADVHDRRPPVCVFLPASQKRPRPNEPDSTRTYFMIDDTAHGTNTMAARTIGVDVDQKGLRTRGDGLVTGC
jgi:hypothetical protein